MKVRTLRGHSRHEALRLVAIKSPRITSCGITGVSSIRLLEDKISGGSFKPKRTAMAPAPARAQRFKRAAKKLRLMPWGKVSKCNSGYFLRKVPAAVRLSATKNSTSLIPKFKPRLVSRSALLLVPIMRNTLSCRGPKFGLVVKRSKYTCVVGSGDSISLNSKGATLSSPLFMRYWSLKLSVITKNLCMLVWYFLVLAGCKNERPTRNYNFIR